MDRVSHAMRIVGGLVGGKYKISRVLGIGGMGAVYEARHAYTNRRVAVKLLGPDFVTSQEAVDRFLQEAQAPSSIGHPNIVEVLDAGEDPDVGLYVVLEFLEGEDLKSAVERETIDQRTLLVVVSQLLDALGAAHARGFVHRDIKPANIFLTKNRDGSMRAKLLDFGIAKNVARGLTVGNAVMGTPHYMAPEQAQGLTVDPRADLWAVGAVLFHALAGVPPYDGDNPNVIMVNIIMSEPPSLRTHRPDLSRQLLDLVDRALKKPLDARWPDAEQMANALAAVPELHGGVVKITSTLRNRSGAISGMRPGPVSTPAPARVDPLARVGTGTLGPEDDDASSLAVTPRAPTPAPAPARVAPTAPVVAPPPPVAVTAAPATGSPPTRRRGLVIGGVAALVACAVLGATVLLRPSSSPPGPAVAPRTVAQPPQPEVHAIRTATPTPTPTPPTATPDASAVAASDATAVAAQEPAESRHGRHGRHARHADGATAATTTSTPAPAQPSTPAAPNNGTRIGGLHIGAYGSP